MPSIKLRESKESEVEIKKELSAPASPFYPDYIEDIEYNDEDDDEDYDKFYKNYVPLTGLKQAKRRKKFKQSVYWKLMKPEFMWYCQKYILWI